MSRVFISEQQRFDSGCLCLFRLKNAQDCYVEVLNLGASLVSVVVPDRSGHRENVVLRYDKISDYLTDSAYLGATVGRFANRISNATFNLNGTTHYLDKNDGEHSNHGGFSGFNNKLFTHHIDGDSLVLSAKSDDGEGGFPGNMRFSVQYVFGDDNVLHITYKAASDRDTLFNPTNHAYFDLSAGKGNPLEHCLKVESDYYLETDDCFLPTGKILSIKNTAFDFGTYTSFNDMLPRKSEVLHGYNTYFIGRVSSGGGLCLRASLMCRDGGRVVQVFSDMPGVQCYTGDFLSGRHRAFAGICLEAQGYPDAPTYKHFPSCVLPAGIQATAHIDYRFSSD